MKTPTILSALLCFLAIIPIQGQIKSVDFPVYSMKNSENIEITRIELSDTTTIVFTEVYSRPNYWIKISSGTTLHGLTTGKEYKLLSSDGFELDQQINMPVSGNVSFKLFFEPLDKKEQKISFVEGKNNGDYLIQAIELNENYKKMPVCCHLSGTVVDRPQSSRLILCRDLADIRTKSWLSIPIHNGKFDYKLYTNIEDRYNLIFWDESLNGSMLPVSFFAENGKIQFTLYPYSMKDTDIPHEIITTSLLTKEMLTYKKKEQKKFSFDDIRATEKALAEAGNYYTETYKSFWKKFNETKTPEERDKLYKERDSLEESGAFYTDAAKAIKRKSELRSDSLFACRLKQIAQSPTLNSLFLLQTTMDYYSHTKKDIAPCMQLYRTLFEKKFANHPAGKEFQQLIDAMNVKVGGTFVDFTVPDLDGNQVQLSHVINNKIALIDLWASWCGPCRRRSISMIPVYNKYKDKGFTIIGVAREKGNTEAMKNAIKKDNYPWQNLVELNDKAKIWSKYGIANAAGGTFLIDKSGRILAINPSVEEVEALLEKRL